ncbi:hypothetical protein AVEN_260723-1 [Araneus ventricosus]|uniref:Uncharacterized protein n=1 Tax=Araneus ventricosus TaxID=182803 RepID=A0A4Y2NYE7_ARAVE|nr:hypothetical protein AVEN_260723-1 [Araneus ventricosus]
MLWTKIHYSFVKSRSAKLNVMFYSIPDWEISPLWGLGASFFRFHYAFGLSASTSYFKRCIRQKPETCCIQKDLLLPHEPPLLSFQTRKLQAYENLSKAKLSPSHHDRKWPLRARSSVNPLLSGR